MNVAEGGGDKQAGLIHFQCGSNRMMGIYRSRVGSVSRCTMGGEFEISDLVRKLIPVRQKEQLNPADMMRRGVGVRNLFQESR